MAYGNFVIIFITFTLLQCDTQEIVTTVPESWYSANVIKDGTFSPKPISELFSTNIDTFSTANPIIVLPPSTPNPLLSSSIQTSLDPFLTSTFSTRIPPLASVSNDPSTFQTFSTTVPPPPPPSSPAVTLQFTQSTLPPSFQTPPPSLPPNIQYIICPSCQPASIPPVSVTTTSPAPSVTTSPISLSTARPFPSTFPSQTPCAPNTQVTQRPVSTARTGFPYIRIRMFSSRGVPIVANLPRSTTPRTTTTRRPRKNRKNNYGACVDACGRRNPICAAPLATRPITSDSLKGFPSICHMACFNSFNKNQYEKVVDGRCGRLRTRIRPVGSKDKIKKDDLNKTQYQVVSGGDPHTIIEVSQTNTN